MHRHRVPVPRSGGTVGSGWSNAALDGEAVQRRTPASCRGRAAGFLQHPIAHLGVQIGQIAETARGQEVAPSYLTPPRRCPSSADPRGTGIDPETASPRRALGVGALHLRIAGARAGDGALGVVDDQGRAAPRRTTRRRDDGSRARCVRSGPTRTRRTDGAKQTSSTKARAAALAGGRIDQVGTGAEIGTCRHRPARTTTHRSPRRALAPDAGDPVGARWVVPVNPCCV